MRTLLIVVSLLVLIVPAAARAEQEIDRRKKDDRFVVKKFLKGEAVEAAGGWPKISVKSVFDPTRGGDYIAIVEVDDKRMFVREGERLGECTVLRIDGQESCITLRMSRADAESKPEEQIAPRPEEEEKKEEVISEQTAAESKPEEHVVIQDEEEKQEREDIGEQADDLEGARSFCIDIEAKPEEGWEKIAVKSVFTPSRSGVHVAVIQVNGRRRFIRAGEMFDRYKVVGIDGEKKCVTIIRRR